MRRMILVALLVAAASAALGGAVITVVRRSAAAPDCAGGLSIDAQCFAARYEALTRSAGVQVALADLTERRKANPYLIAACHQLTHVIGRAAGELNGKAAFRQGTNVCSSGYYHGVTEAVMTRIGREHILERAQTVCAEQRESQPHSYAHYNCVHGTGHGFMSVFGSDVFKSLAGCDTLLDPWEQGHCFGGVFMENLTASESPTRRSTQLRPQEPLYPCTAVAERHKPACYAQQTSYALYVRNDDFSAVFVLCRDDADRGFRAACYEGLGGDAAVRTSKYVIGATAQAHTVRTLCIRAPDDEARAHCIVGAVTTIVRDLAGNDEPARALCTAIDERRLNAVCETARLDTLSRFAGQEPAHHH